MTTAAAGVLTDWMYREVLGMVCNQNNLRALCAASILLSLAAAGCRSAPVTGRKQLMVVPEEKELALGLTSFQEVTAKEPPTQNSQYAEIVNRVGQRIAAVAGRPDYQWEFKVIASSEQNAFCLPGGKVAVYEGILPVCQNEAGLAVVMSHEVAHALARHGGERMSQNYAVDISKQALSYVTQSQDEVRREIFNKAYGVATEYGILLPYSRKHESEADHIGLMLMAKAGYTPEEAPRFWQRFGASKQGTQPSAWMSTHPSDQRRSQDLTALLPEAMQLYLQAQTRYDMGDMLVIAPTPPSAAAPAAASLAGKSPPTAAPPASSGTTAPAGRPPGAAPSGASSGGLFDILTGWLPSSGGAKAAAPGPSSPAAAGASPGWR